MKYITALSLLFSMLVGCAPNGSHDPDSQGMQEILQQVRDGQLPISGLTVTYTDMHGFHGGLLLRIYGEGKIEQEAERIDAREPKDSVPKGDILRLIDLLLSQKAWEQREPYRAPVPDESDASLIIHYQEQECKIWEWYNDLEKNQRIILIREFMKSIAWN